MKTKTEITTKIILITATLLLLQLSIGISQETTCLDTELTIDSTAGGEVVEPGEGTFKYREGRTVEIKAQPHGIEFRETKNQKLLALDGDEKIENYYTKTTDVSKTSNLYLEVKYKIEDADPGEVEGGFIVEITGKGVDEQIWLTEENKGKYTQNKTINVQGIDEVEVNYSIYAWADTGAFIEIMAQEAMHSPHKPVNYEFTEWTGDTENIDDPKSPETTITMEDDYSITAEFREKPNFKINIYSPKEGEHFKTGDKIDVKYQIDNTGDLSDTQYIRFEVNDELEEVGSVSLEPGETEYYYFTWTAKQGEHELKVKSETHQDTVQIGVDTEPAHYNLDVNIEGDGQVDIDPDEDEYEEGTEVDLEAIAYQDWYFEGWTGDVESDDHEITITMDSNKSITANFEKIYWPKAELISPEHGEQNVSTNPVLKVNITHPEDKLTNITFRDYKEKEDLATFEDIENGTVVPYKWEGLKENTTYRWYVRLESKDTTVSYGIWNFTTKTDPEPPEPALLSANAGGDREAIVGEPITLRGTGSSHRSRIVKYKWDFIGNGEWDYESTETGITQTTYEYSGIYRPKLKVIDEYNRTNHDTVEIRVMEEITLVPEERIREALDTIWEADISISPIYEYEPEENKTTVKYSFRNQLEENRNIRIKMEIPTKVTNTIEDLRITPSPDKEELKNIITWDTSLSPRELTEIQIQKQGYIPRQHVEEIQINIRDIDVEEPEPTPTEPTTLAGMVTGALASPAAGLTVLFVLIILGLGYYKREDMRQRLIENLEK